MRQAMCTSRTQATLVGAQGGSLQESVPPRIAVLIPCYNEESTIGKVVDDFRLNVPGARVYVYDNNSSDRTAQVAAAHGAYVVSEPRQGKGHVVRQMLRDVDADIYVLVDGDDTYPAESAHELIAPIADGNADLVIGDRLSNQSYRRENKRQFHSFGNSLVCVLIGWLYRTSITDALSGYRAFSRTFAKTFPILSQGFDIEVEMDIHALDKNWRVREVPVTYRDRPEGSFSKLSTVQDGFLVLKRILSLFKDYRPLILFSAIAFVLTVLGLALGIGVVVEFFRTGLVERFPTAILSVGLVTVGLLSLTCGLVLDTVVKNHRKQYEVIVMQEFSKNSKGRLYE
jgi:glycosyltransferase involved in cell wall biosynthesis